MSSTVNSETKALIDSLYGTEYRFASQIPQRCTPQNSKPLEKNTQRTKANRAEGSSKAVHQNVDRKYRYSAYPAKAMVSGWFVDEPMTGGRKRTLVTGSSAAPQRDINPRLARGQRMSKIPQRRNVYDIPQFGKNKIPIIKVPITRKPAPKQVTLRKSNICTIQTPIKIQETEDHISPHDVSAESNCPQNDNQVDGDCSYDEELQQKAAMVSQNEQEETAVTSVPAEETVTEKSATLEGGDAENENNNYNAELLGYWTEKLETYLKMKEELQVKQRDIMHLYASLRDTHNKMTREGQQVHLPPAHDLRVLNVGNLTPDELNMVCSRPGTPNNISGRNQNVNTLFDIDRLYKAQEKIVAACNLTLEKRQEIIDWFKSLLDANSKGIKTKSLISKVNEFHSENQALSVAIESTRAEITRDIDEVSIVLRKSVSNTMNLQLKTEELTYENSELNSLNMDLRKQLQMASTYNKTRGNKGRIEGLERELKEEKCKKTIIRDRLIRAENQVKLSSERVTHLEAAVEKVRAEAWNLERTIAELQEQNLTLQTDFDKELGKLTKSVQENTHHLEQIGEAREKLQQEKEELERQLEELTNHYSNSLQQMQSDVKSALDKSADTERALHLEREEKKELQHRIEKLAGEQEEWVLRCKELSGALQERDLDLRNALNLQAELDSDLKQGLQEAKAEVAEYKEKLSRQHETIQDLEKVLKDNMKLIEDLNNEVGLKTKRIAELEERQTLLDDQLREGESKMESYVNQLSSLKNNLKKIKADLGDFENINELQSKMSELREKLDHVTKENIFFNEELEKKNNEISQYSDKVKELDQMIELKNNVIKELEDKELEQSETLERLQKKLAQLNEGHDEYKEKLAEKDCEIIALYTNVEKRKQQISQLEKIVYTLEDQTQQANYQRQKDRDMINELEQKLAVYEEHLHAALKSAEDPIEHVDSLIKLFEDELGAPLDQQLLDTDSDFTSQKQSMKRAKTSRKMDNYVKESRIRQPYQSGIVKETATQRQTQCEIDPENVPAKIVMANFVKKTYIPDKYQHSERNRDQQKSYESSSESIIKNKNDFTEFILNNKTFISKPKDTQRYRNERQNKLLKLACHKIL